MMTIIVFLFIFCIVAVLQIFIPYIVKNTVVFGVTVPEQFVYHNQLNQFKKNYAMIVAIVSIVVAVIASVLLIRDLSEAGQVIVTVAAVYIVLMISMALYFFYHKKVSKLKKEEAWGAHLRQVRVTDTTVRQRDTIVPWPFLIIPMLLSIALMGYTLLNYAKLPDLIAIHWGLSGAADDWTEKTAFTAIFMPLMLLIMQWMMVAIIDGMKHSGIKINVNLQEQSIHRQLEIRKFTAWFIVVLMYVLTLVFTVVQLTTVHEQFAKTSLLLPFFNLILVASIGGTVLYVWKLYKLKLEYPQEMKTNLTDADEDHYWKGGLLYFNPNDPSVFVEKRFGVGWTLNLASMRGYMVFILPLVLLLVLSFTIL